MHLSPLKRSARISLLAAALLIAIVPASGAEPTTLLGHRKPVVDVEFSADGSHLASIADDGETILWDLSAGTGARGPSVERSLSVGSTYLRFTREDRPLLMAGCDIRGFVVDPDDMKPVAEWRDPKKAYADALTYVGGHRVLIRDAVKNAGTEDAAFTVVDRRTLAALSPNGKKWFTNYDVPLGDDKRVQTLDAATGETLCDLKAFTSIVRAVAWAGDDRTLTMTDGGEFGGSLMLWDVSGTGKLLAKIDLPGAWLLAASADGTSAAVALRKNKIALVRIGPKQLQAGPVLDAGLWSDREPTFAMSKDGSRVLAASPSDPRRQLVVFDAATGAELLVQQREEGDALPELSPDGTQLAIGRADGSISLSPVGAADSQNADGPLTQILDKPLEHPRAPGMQEAFRGFYLPYRDGRIEVAPGGTTIVVGRFGSDNVASIASGGAEGRHLPIWETTSTGPSKKELPTWTMLPDGTFLAEGVFVGADEVPKIHSGRADPTTGQFRLSPRSRNLQITSMEPGPDGTLMAVRAAEWSWDGRQRQQAPAKLMLLDMMTGEVVRTLASELDSATPCWIVFSESGDRLAVLERWKLRVFEVASGDEIPLAGEWEPTRFWFMNDGKTLAFQESDGSIVGIDLETQAESLRWNPANGQNGQVTAVDISRDGRIAAVGGQTGDLTLRDARDGAVIFRTRPFDLPIVGVGFAPDGSALAAADDQRRLIAWKLGSLEKEAAPAASARTIRVADE